MFLWRIDRRIACGRLYPMIPSLEALELVLSRRTLICHATASLSLASHIEQSHFIVIDAE